MQVPATSARATKRFCLILVKPSHYDDDGYVIQWFRSTIPSNSLAAVYGLARDCAERHVLGEDVACDNRYAIDFRVGGAVSSEESVQYNFSGRRSQHGRGPRRHGFP